MPQDSQSNDAPESADVRHGVLSDQDIKREITEGLIFTSDHGEDLSEGVEGSCYNLRVGYLISKRDGVAKEMPHSSPARWPRCSREWLELPPHITGLVIPRNRQAKRGFLILNAGHVDPTWRGQIMAQVVNLANQDRAVQLDSYEQGIFSVVFSYLETPARRSIKRPRVPPDMKKAEQQRVAEEHRLVSEQAETLVLAESVMREKFVPQDQFTAMLWVRMLAFLAIMGVIVAVLAGLKTITDSTISTDWNWKLFGPLTLATFLGVLAGAGAYEGLRFLWRTWIRPKLWRHFP